MGQQQQQARQQQQQRQCPRSARSAGILRFAPAAALELVTDRRRTSRSVRGKDSASRLASGQRAHGSATLAEAASVQRCQIIKHAVTKELVGVIVCKQEETAAATTAMGTVKGRNGRAHLESCNGDGLNGLRGACRPPQGAAPWSMTHPAERADEAAAEPSTAPQASRGRPTPRTRLRERRRHNCRSEAEAGQRETPER